MQTSRRSFFTRLLPVGAIGNAAAGSGLVKNLRVAANGVANEVRPDDFVGGYVKEAHPDSIVVDGGAGPVTLWLRKAPQIWKGAYNKAVADILADDFLYATATRLPSGDLEAARVWVNIVHLQGMARSIRPDDLDLEFVDHQGRTHVHQVRLPSTVEIFDRSDNPVRRRPGVLIPNRAVGIVGECKPDGVHAFRIWI